MDWHKRFVQQATWTESLRHYLFERAGMGKASRVLEVGCGTGALLNDLATNAAVHGLDLDPRCLVEAHWHAPQAFLTCGDGMTLPYGSGSFDIIFCHFLLLWVRDPLQALMEMKRVTRPGGSVLALAEPDYNARLDKPDALVTLGRLQTEALRQQGANPGLGGRLAQLFQKAGLPPIETGVLQADLKYAPSSTERLLEWTILENDLAGMLPAEELQRLKGLDRAAWESGERVLYVPTYFAWGRVTQMV